MKIILHVFNFYLLHSFTAGVLCGPPLFFTTSCNRLHHWFLTSPVYSNFAITFWIPVKEKSLLIICLSFQCIFLNPNPSLFNLTMVPQSTFEIMVLLKTHEIKCALGIWLFMEFWLEEVVVIKIVTKETKYPFIHKTKCKQTYKFQSLR